MEITLEQVERLKEKANVSYGAAKKALEFSSGNMLDAMIYLEETGYLNRPEGGNFSTQSEKPQDHPESAVVQTEPQKQSSKRSFLEWLKWLGHLVVDNELEFWRKEQLCLSVPIIIPGILLLTTPWITIPVLALGMLLGFRYRITGPGLERENFGEMLRTMADTAADVSRQVMEEISARQRKNKERQNQEKGTDSEPN